MMIHIKRVYEPASAADGARYLVERLWPRGVKKEDLSVQAWVKEVAPSAELRQWFHHDPARWAEFVTRYRGELDAHPEAWEPLLEAAKHGPVTLIYSAHDVEHNNALVLQAYLEERLAQGSAHGHKKSRAGGGSAPER